MISCLTIASSPNRGRGVFTTKGLKKGTVLEKSPVIVLTEEERKIAEQTLLYHYLFEWGKDEKEAALALGYVSLYNHSYNANCEYEMDFNKKIMTVKTVRDIQKGEELFVNYNAVHDDKTQIWFQAE